MNTLDDFVAFAKWGDVFLFYRGYVSQPMIEASAEAIRRRLQVSDVKYPTQRKLVGAFIEMAQNIVHYSADTLTDPAQTVDEMRYGALCIARHDGGFALTCANPVNETVARRLGDKLGLLSRLSLEEIKQMYRAALRAEGEAQSKGGGIGLLALARDSSRPIEFSMPEAIDAAGNRTFSLSVFI